MAIARINAQDASATGNHATITATYASTPTQGNLLIAFYMNTDALGTIPGFTSIANLKSGSGGAGQNSFGLYYKVAGAAESKNVTHTDSFASTIYLEIHEYNGFVGTPTLDQSASANGAVNPASTGTTATTTAANELLFAVATDGNLNTFTSWSNSFTSITNSAQSTYSAQQIVSSTGAYTTAATLGGTVWDTAGIIATFMDVPKVPHVKFNNAGLRPHPFSPGLAR